MGWGRKRGSGREVYAKTALAVPTASAMSKAASHAMAEAATSEMSETYAVTHAVVQATHAAMAEAMIEGAVVRVPAIKYVGVAVIAVIPA
jgi:hypothetical protein